MKQPTLTIVLAGAVALATPPAVMWAQSPPSPTPPTATTERQPRAQANEDQVVTVEGCVAREADVPGRRPNVAERAGIGEDFILTNARVVKGNAPAPLRNGAGGAAAGTAAQNAMFEIEGIDDGLLKQHVGQRVQIDGTFENVDRAQPTAERQPPNDDLVEIRGTSIRQASGTCGAR